jgi:tetratricopeptide (TPR) repeat protein
VPKDDRLPGTSSDAAAIVSLDAERDVMLAMIRRAAAEGRDSQPPLITTSLGNFFDVREAWTDWLEAAELAVASAERTGDPQVLAAALLQRSWPLRLMRHTTQATADAESALRELGDVPAGILHGEVLSHLGTLYREAHRYEDAIRCLAAAIAIFQGAGDQRREGLALRTLGHVQSWRMDLAAAQATLERGIGLLRAAHDRLGEAWSHANLCEVFGYAWRYDDAAAESAAAREIFDDLGSRQGAAWALNHMGRINLQYGRVTRAIRPFLGKFADAVTSKAADAAADSVGSGTAALYRTIRKRMARDGYHQAILQGAEDQPDSDERIDTLSRTLASILKADPEFASAIADLAGQTTQSFAVSDSGAVAARDVSITAGSSTNHRTNPIRAPSPTR